MKRPLNGPGWTYITQEETRMSSGKEQIFGDCGHSFFPLPLWEGVAKLRAHASNEPGEGSAPNAKQDPSPGPRLRLGPPSPTRVEGEGVVWRGGEVASASEQRAG